MRFILLYFILFFCLAQCRDISKSETVIRREAYYPDGKIKEVAILNSDSLKNGESSYFSKEGHLDSTVTFKLGIRDGMKKIFYDNEYGTYTYLYKSDSLVLFRLYDSSNQLRYEEPFDVTNIPPTTFKFISNRTYFDKNKTDTILFINPQVPPYNRGYNIYGALLSRINDQLFRIEASKHLDSLKEIIIKVEIYQKVGSTKPVLQRIDSLKIPVK